MRTHGFERPLDRLQIGTWLLLPLLVVGFYVFAVPVLPLGWAIATGIFFGTAVICTIAAAYLCTIAEAADKAVAEVRGSRRSLNVSPAQGSADTVYCHVCSSYVHKSSKHCRLCDKCVHGFDHHCKWLNNCIGTYNYRYFLVTVASVIALCLCHGAVEVYILVWVLVQSDEADSKVNDLFGWSSAKPLLGITIGYIAVLLPCCIMVLQLGGFHVMLVYKGMTTYDFIVAQRRGRQRRARERQAQARESTVLCRPCEADSETRVHTRQDKPPESEGVRNIGPKQPTELSPAQLETGQDAQDKGDPDTEYSSIRSPDAEGEKAGIADTTDLQLRS